MTGGKKLQVTKSHNNCETITILTVFVGGMAAGAAYLLAKAIS